MSMSRCGNIRVMPSICSCKERRRGFSNRSSVDAAVSGRSCVFLGQSKSTLFGLPKVDAFRIHYLQQNSNAFYGRQFLEPRRGGHSDFAMTNDWALLNQRLCVLLLD